MSHMNTAEERQMEFVCARVKDTRKFFRSRRDYNRFVAWCFACAATLLSATATVALGLKDDPKTVLDIIALGASALATVVSATEGIFAHRKLWHLNNLAMAALDKLDRAIGFRKADPTPLSADEVKGFFEGYETISAEIDQKWVDTYAVK